jgi:hypothetical protein
VSVPKVSTVDKEPLSMRCPRWRTPTGGLGSFKDNPGNRAKAVQEFYACIADT